MISKGKPLTVTELARMGGLARAAQLTPEQQSAIGKKAVAAREAKRGRSTTKIAAPADIIPEVESQTTRNDQRQDKNAEYKFTSKRSHQLAQGQYKRMVNFLSAAAGACMGLPELDRGMIRAACLDGGELETWVQSAMESAKALQDFAAGIMSKNAAQSRRPARTHSNKESIAPKQYDLW